MVSRRDWRPIIDAADQIVRSYTYPITLRQLHYRLVMTPGLGYLNTEGDYKRLSDLTAVGRRAGTFLPLLDQTRNISQAETWSSPAAALEDVSAWYRRDRTEGQEFMVVLGGEKATLLAQLDNWFGMTAQDDLGMPIVLLRGYSSQTYVDLVRDRVLGDGRKAIMIYAGDYDPSGEDILDDFKHRCPVWAEVRHIAVRPQQIQQFVLPVAMGKVTDPRAKGFIARNGQLVQVELEALDPADLQRLYRDAINAFWDESAYNASRAQEQKDRLRLAEIAAGERYQEQGQ